MFGTHDLWLFIISGLLLNITPGPDTALVVARSTQMGLRGGVAASFGITGGIMVHIAAAAIGLSALIAASATAFSVIKYAGAAYLIYIGLRLMFARQAAAADAAAPRTPSVPLRSVFWQGFFSNALNPKVAIFFLAFLPQFVEVERGHVAMQVAFLGILFAVLGSITDGCYALAAGTMGNWLKGSRGYLKVERYVSGVLFIGLGLTAAFAGNHRK